MNPEDNNQTQPPVENNQPLTPEQPTPPNQPTQLAPAQPGQPMQPQAKSSNSKLWIILAAVGGGLLLLTLLIITILALTVWSGPSKQEYKDAQKAFDSTKASYNSAASRLKLYVASSGSFLSSTTQKNFEQAYGEYKTKADGLKSLKALKDKDLQKKYDEFTAKDAKLRAYVASFTDSMDDFSTASTACDASKASGLESASPETFVSAYDSAVADCKAVLVKLKQAKNKSVAEYATKVDKLYGDLRAVLVETVDAYNAKDRARYDAARAKLETVSDSFKSVDSPSTKIQSEISSLSVDPQLSALSDFASQKSK